ncbi:MAG: (2Fe-2S) ferredoxin domain-containing protein, partial [Oscillospiraceae bacterium]|nr:(2Fe-2S) ferredoxin domain-containing protein [Oscillospiraceae bacterium]
MTVQTKADLLRIQEEMREARASETHHVYVCGGGGCISTGCQQTKDAVVEYLTQTDLAKTVGMTFTGCMGLCTLGPVLVIEPEGVFYVKVSPQMAKEILYHHIGHGRIIEAYT